ncbi:MAG: transposase [Bacteroidetes bacterium]|nr:transposase [Bacteroidota bacterium]
MFRKIDIGRLVLTRMEERNISLERMAERMGVGEPDLQRILANGDISCSILLRICKILEYDFFRIYSNHLILYAPPNMQIKSFGKNNHEISAAASKLPVFRKNTYTPEIIMHILEKIRSGEMTPMEIIHKYHIPKTTIYKWKRKYL